MNQLLKAALAYRSRGWSIIPVSPIDKTPLVKWTEYQERLPTNEEIREWWTIHPRANIALVTGKVSGIVAVDVDVRKGYSIDAAWKRGPTGLAAYSGGGGAHLYYAHPGQAVPSVEDKKRGFELKGEGANITLPPSIHPSGKRYEWAVEDSPSPFPKVLLKPHTNGNGKKPTEPWVSELMQGVGEGDRNTAVARLAGYYLSKGIPVDAVVETLAAWDFKNRPPLGRELIQQSVESIKRTRDRKAPEEYTPQLISHASSAEEPFGLMRMNQYMTQFGDAPVTWAVEDWLPEETIAMAVAPPGTFKTWLELALAVSVASGKRFLGQYEIRRPGPVIVIQQEDYHGQMAERLAVVTGSLFDFGASNNGSRFRFQCPPDLPIFLHPDRRFRFNDQVVLESLEEKIATIRPSLVIIDPLYSTGPVDDFGVGLVERMWPLKSLRDRYRCSFFISHHTGKGKTETEREDAWGTQFLNAFIETGWQIRRKGEQDTAIIRRHFKVRKDIEEQAIKFDISTQPPYKFDVSLRAVTAKDAEHPDLIEIITHHGPLTQAEMAKIAGTDKSNISRRLKKLREANVVFCNAQGEYTITPMDV